MYKYIFLCLFFAQIQAADDRSIDAMMQRLRAEEGKGQCDGERRFVYKEPYEGSVVDDFLPEDLRNTWFQFPLGGIRGVMRDHNALHEVDYFKKLGASKQLSDEQKLSEQMVRTPYFDQLAHKEQEEKDNVLRQLLERVNGPQYPVSRLLFAASLHIGASVNVLKGKHNNLLQRVLLQDDVLLVDLALQKGADPNQREYSAEWGDSILRYCESIEAAGLMVKYGARVAEASWQKEDLVYHACFTGKIKVLPFYLEHITPSESNGFGSVWMKKLAQGGYVSEMVEQVEILLEYGCQYDKETKSKICAYVAKKSPELKERIEQVFVDAEIKKDIKG